MEEILGMMGGLGKLLGGMFPLMEARDRVLLEKMEQYPDQAKILWFSDPFLHDFTHFEDMVIELWEYHVREIYDRIGQKCTLKQLNLGTRAQVVLGCIHTSIKVPLDSVGTGLYEYLFREVLGDDIYLELYADSPHMQEKLKDVDEAKSMTGEQWPGQFEELIHEFQRTLSHSNKRELPDPDYIQERYEWDIKNGSTLPYLQYCKEDVQLSLV